MKKPLIIGLMFFLVLQPTKAQYSFDFYQDTFNFLDTTQATNLTQGYAWPFGSDYYRIPIGFDFITNNDQTFDSVEVIPTEGYIGFYQQCDFGPNTSSGPELIGFFTGLQDRGWVVNNPLSPVSYITEGIAGNRIFKVEWNNATMDIGNDWLDFQVWLYEGTNIAEIRYGASFVADTTSAWTFNPDGPMVLFGYDMLCNPLTGLGTVLVHGYRNNPQYSILDTTTPPPPVVTITSVPDSGMVYRFEPWPLSVQESSQQKQIEVYPNPTTGLFTVQGTATAIQVYDLFGHLLLRSNNRQIDMSSFPKGLYLYQIKTHDATVRGKLVKQ